MLHSVQLQVTIFIKICERKTPKVPTTLRLCEQVILLKLIYFKTFCLVITEYIPVLVLSSTSIYCTILVHKNKQNHLSGRMGVEQLVLTKWSPLFNRLPFRCRQFFSMLTLIGARRVNVLRVLRGIYVWGLEAKPPIEENGRMRGATALRLGHTIKWSATKWETTTWRRPFCYDNLT